MKRLLFLIVAVLRLSEIGLPAQTMYASHVKGEQIIEKARLTISYSKACRIPNYVGYYITNADFKYREVLHREDFYGDTAVQKKYRAYPSDYNGSGYDRGHMSPAADWRASKAFAHDSYSMLNVCPMNPELNRKWWVKTENGERYAATWADTVYVIAGQFSGKKKAYINGRICIPQYFYKVIVAHKRGKERMVRAWIYLNNGQKQDVQKNMCDVTEIEKRAGITIRICKKKDALTAVRKHHERRVRKMPHKHREERMKSYAKLTKGWA